VPASTTCRTHSCAWRSDASPPTSAPTSARNGRPNSTTILHRATLYPLTRLIIGLRYAAGLLRTAPQIASSLAVIRQHGYQLTRPDAAAEVGGRDPLDAVEVIEDRVAIAATLSTQSRHDLLKDILRVKDSVDIRHDPHIYSRLFELARQVVDAEQAVAEWTRHHVADGPRELWSRRRRAQVPVDGAGGGLCHPARWSLRRWPAWSPAG
jgi:hypothetical protein